MSNVWKWILGILAVLIVLGLLAGAGFMWKSRSFYMTTGAFEPRYFDRPGPPDAPGTPRGCDAYPRYHMYAWGGGMPMMGYGHGYAPYPYGPMGTGFMPVSGLFHMLFPLGVLALVAYIFYQMGKRAGIAAGPPAPPRPLPDADSLPRRKVAKG